MLERGGLWVKQTKVKTPRKRDQAWLRLINFSVALLVAADLLWGLPVL